MRQPFNWTAADLAGRGLYLSDLHAGRDTQADDDLRAMLNWLVAADHGYCWICWGGDIFDFLAAGNQVSLSHTPWVLDAMRALAARGVRQFLIEGNHDFHLGFLAEMVPGLVVVPDGLRDDALHIALVHGDWHTAGGLYGPMRRVFRSAWLRTVLSAGPHALIDRVARAWSRGSHEVRGGPPEAAYLGFVAQCLRAAMSEETLLHTWLTGHIHWPACVQRQSSVCYINGEWAIHRTMIEVEAPQPPRYLVWMHGHVSPYADALTAL